MRTIVKQMLFTAFGTMIACVMVFMGNHPDASWAELYAFMTTIAPIHEPGMAWKVGVSAGGAALLGSFLFGEAVS